MELKQLAGKTALVTGGNRGLGRAIATALAKLGVRVGICGRNPSSIDESVHDLSTLAPGSWGMTCNVRSEEEQSAFFNEAKRRFERLDICIPNAGEATLASVTQTRLEDWNRDIETNLTGTFLTIRNAMTWMKESGGGLIIPIVSQAGKVGFFLRAAYCSSKWGTLGLIECARLEGKEHGIRFTAICPASVATDFQAENPMGTDWMMRSEDVVDAVLYAASVSDRVELPEILIRCWKKPSKK